MREFKVGGIYEIKCSETGKFYIGSSVLIWDRWRGHRNELRVGRHHNSRLQNAWNKYGEEAFRLRTLQEVPRLEGENESQYRKRLRGIEQGWIDESKCWDPEIGFNLARDTTGPMVAYPCSDETRKRLSESLKGKKRSPETKARMAVAIQKVWDSGSRRRELSEETKKKMSLSRTGKERKTKKEPKRKRIRVHNGVDKECNLIPERAEKLLKEGWIRGRLAAYLAAQDYLKSNSTSSAPHSWI
jgi:group I intron endonuclease